MLPDGRQLPLRILADVELTLPWRVPVLVPDVGHRAGRQDACVDGTITITDERGLVRVDVEVVGTGGGLVLQGLGPATIAQRRDDVRGEVEVGVHVARLDDARPDGFSGPIVRGVSLDVSAGGLRVSLERQPGRDAHRASLVRVGGRVYTELTLPGEGLVRAVSLVVGADDAGLLWRARFERVDGAGRDQLARLVFAAQRAALAERSRRRAQRDLLVGSR